MYFFVFIGLQYLYFSLSNDSLAWYSEKAMAPHSSTLAWKIPWMEEPGGLQSMGSLRVGHGWVTSLSLFTFMHWRRKWQPTQCSCLENPRDSGACWAAVHGVAQSGTRLKWLAAAAAAAWRFAPLNTRHWETHVLCIELAPVIFNLNLSENSQISSECVTFYKAVFLGCLKNVRVTKSNKK